MKVNFIAPSIGHSGGMDVIYKYADLLAKKGNDVVVYKPIKSCNMHRYNGRTKNRVHQIYCSLKGFAASFSPKRNDKFVWKVANETVRDADVVIATSWPTAYMINKLSSQKGDKYYFVQDFEVWDNRKMGLESYRLPLKKIVISSWINKKLHDELGIGPFPIVYNGIDTTIYRRCNTNKKAEKVQLLMLNHTLEKKGVKYGLRVFEEISSRYSNCKLLMFGTCDGSNLPDYVEYYQCPSKEKLVELYSSSDIFIFPSLEEGWGLTPLEAMACGCAVVGTRTGFALDFGIHEKNMMISNPGECEGMVRNIEELLRNPKKLETIKAGGLELATQLKWDDSVNLLETLLRDYATKPFIMCSLNCGEREC